MTPTERTILSILECSLIAFMIIYTISIIIKGERAKRTQKNK